MIQKIKNITRSLLLPKNRLIILTYHQVSKVFDPKYHHKNIWLSSEIFEKQLIQLKNNYCILPLKDALDKLKSGNIKETTFVLTFDDGDKTLESDIVPMLEKYELPAVFFINSAYLDSNRSYWFTINNFLRNHADMVKDTSDEYLLATKNIRRTHDPKEYEKYTHIIENRNSDIPEKERFTVSFEFLRSLNPELFSVGLHGHEHQRFSMMPSVWKRENITKNRDILEKLPGYINAFAIPFGSKDDWDNETIKFAKDLNLDVLLAVKGYNTKYTDILLRDSVTEEYIGSFLNNQSPFMKKYLKLNGITK